MYRACGQFWSIFAGGRRKGKTYGAAKCGNHDTSAGNPRKRCEGAGNRYQNRVRSHTEKQATFKPDLSSKYRKKFRRDKKRYRAGSLYDCTGSVRIWSDRSDP